MDNAPTFSIVIPVYNSEATLHDLLKEIVAVLPILPGKTEVILVNDGSSDRSWDIICEMAAAFNFVRGIHLARNFGQHAAILCGLRSARHEITITMDDDLQHPPSEIPKLIGKLSEGYDVVYGPPTQEQHGLLRDLASLATKFALSGFMGVDIARNVNALRAFRTELRNAFPDFRGPFVSIDVLLTWGTRRFGVVRVQHNRRRAGQSQYTFAKLVAHAMNMATGFSVLPLQAATYVGFSFSLFGLAILGYVLVRYAALGGSVPGFPFLASIIAIFSGAQLFAIGVIGEYLARMHFRLMGRPTYIVKKVINE